MGKMILILLFGTGMIVGIIQLNNNNSSTALVNTVVNEYSEIQATNIANNGIEIAVRYLSEDTLWQGTNSLEINDGSLTINVQETSSRYFNGPEGKLNKARLVTSIGTYNGSTKTIRAVVKLPGSDVMRAPKFLRYSIASELNLTLGGNITIKDDNNPQWNADVHTNQSFFMNGNNIINGFLTYLGTAGSSPSHRINTNINPNQNPDLKPNYYKTSELAIPNFNPEEFKDVAHEILTGNVTISGNKTLGTKDNPKIIYVEGTLTISGNFTGYGAIVVKGSVVTNGNIDFTAYDPSGNNLGIYTDGSVSINGGTVKSQILAGGNVTIGSNSKVYGGITTKGSMAFQGGAEFNYRPATPELTDPFFPRDPDIEVRASIVSVYD
jgi:cytoskeletal protein CcmA (bactofilin family)